MSTVAVLSISRRMVSTDLYDMGDSSSVSCAADVVKIHSIACLNSDRVKLFSASFRL